MTQGGQRSGVSQRQKGDEGAMFSGAASYPLAGDDTSTETDPFQETTLTCERRSDSAIPDLVRHTLFQSRRTGQVLRWHTEFVDDASGPHQWMRRVDFGQSLGTNERWIEDAASEHNPTLGGGIQEPGGSDDSRLVPSPLVYFRNQATQSGGIDLECCVIPLDFDSFGGAAPLANKGGDGDNLVLWHNARQYERVQVMFGHPRIHRVTTWLYFPKAFEAGPAGLSFLGHAISQVYLTDFFGTAQEAEFYDPVTKLSRLLDQGAGEWTTSTNQTWRVTGDRSNPGLDLFSVINRTDPYPFSTRFASAILPGSNGGQNITFATAGVLHRGSSDCGHGMRRLSRLFLDQARDPPAGVGEDINSGQVVSWDNSDARREAGWVGHSFFMVTAQTRTEARGLIDLIHRRRFLDLPTEFTVPQKVIDGMDPRYDNRHGPRTR